MRVFICAFTGFSVAIPMHSVSSLMLYTEEAARTVEYDQENRNTYISLPRLFSLPESVIRHGIILKNDDGNDDNYTIENKAILLTTEVEYETEIPDEEIFPLPKVFADMRFSALFSGIRFDSRPRRERGVSGTPNNPVNYPAGSPVLLLNPEQLVQCIHKEFAV